MSPSTVHSSPRLLGSNSPSPPPPPLAKTESNNNNNNNNNVSVKKRSSVDGGVVKATKRRAARACVSCRARKVRCDVVEGAPCGNCRWDNVECIVQESRRRKKSTLTTPTVPLNSTQAEAHIRCKTLTAATAAAPATTTTTTTKTTTNGGHEHQRINTATATASTTSPTTTTTTRAAKVNTKKAASISAATAPRPAAANSNNGYVDVAAANNNNSNANVNVNVNNPHPRHHSLVPELSATTTATNTNTNTNTNTTNGLEGPLSKTPNYVVDSHIPHLIYQRSGFRPDLLNQPSVEPVSPTSTTLPWGDTVNPDRLFGDVPTPSSLGPPGFPSPLDQFHFQAAAAAAAAALQHQSSPQHHHQQHHLQPIPQLPPFLRPLPSKIAPEDVSYLQMKGALTLPAIPLQNALLQAYVEFIHPYMPLMDLHPFLNIVNSRNGFNGQMSLLLYHAVMFAATAFVDMKPLRDAGYTNRKAARKAFFQKTRLLYDFDYESDRLVLVQSLLLMTYWYETPDDQKDTWHWMGVAISLAHTIGLHRKPGPNSMTTAKRKLWKRIWWSCFMRDRLIALGMRRPTRIKDEDFDVPMLAESDFEIQGLAENNATLPPDCTVIRDLAMQRELAMLCISKAKLCLGISHMLKTQYSVLIRDNMKPENTTNSTMMLFPNKFDNVDAVDTIDAELRAWADNLPAPCQYRPLTRADVQGGRSTVTVHRTLLHMVHQTTISALHRPQFLPSSPNQAPTTSRQVQDISRIKVRDSAMQITHMVTELHNFHLEKYLPTTGVTVILPAMIIHLLEMKSSSPEARDRATVGFRQCMRVMEKLREIYSAADYATGFLDAALRKADISINSGGGSSRNNNNMNAQMMNTINQTNLAATMDMMPNGLPFCISVHTPPPEMQQFPPPANVGTDTAFYDTSKMSVMMPPPNTVNAAILDMANSPPHTDDFDVVVGLTPCSGSGFSEDPLPPPPPLPLTEMGAEADLDDAMDMNMDMDFMEGHDEFDWNAVAGTDFDVDQFLQFPPTEGTGGKTGAGSAGDDLMTSMFVATSANNGAGAGTDASAGTAMEDVKMGIEASA